MLFHISHLTCPSRKGCIEQLFQQGWSLPLSVYVTLIQQWLQEPSLGRECCVWMRAVKWIENMSIRQQYWRWKCGVNWEPAHQLHIFFFLSCLTKTSEGDLCHPGDAGPRLNTSGGHTVMHCYWPMMLNTLQYTDPQVPDLKLGRLRIKNTLLYMI